MCFSRAEMQEATQHQSILITGSSGFLGSQLAYAMAELGHTVYAVDSRQPGKYFSEVLFDYPNIITLKADIANYAELENFFKNFAPADYCYHFASAWSYAIGDANVYQKTNIQGTRNILQLARRQNIKRVFFASTILAVEPVSDELYINEFTPVTHTSAHPYAWAKSASEADIQAFCDWNSANPAVTILRIGGVFSNWCELPPLTWLIDRWTGSDPLGRFIAGKGETGLAYLHRDDFTDMMIKCMLSHDKLPQCGTLLASPSGYTSHNTMYSIIRRSVKRDKAPVHIPVPLAKIGFWGEKYLRTVFATPPPEQSWMFNYIDRPFKVDASETHKILNWKPQPKRQVESCLPSLVQRSKTNTLQWNTIQANRVAVALGVKKDPVAQPNPTLSRYRLFHTVSRLNVHRATRTVIGKFARCLRPG